MRPDLIVPPPARPGDRVAVVSPSFAAPASYPQVHERAMARLRDDLGLVPVEYPTTRRLNATPRDRAADLMAAFADPSVRAVLATIGGEDQITVLPFLDADVVRVDPKPFLGYSDNTNLLNWLWHNGIAGFHGSSTMVHLGRGGGPHPVSLESLRRALFAPRGAGHALDLHPAEEFSEDERDWADPATLDLPVVTQPSPAWHWHQPDTVVTGPSWGGNLEILHSNLAVGRWIRPAQDYAGCVLLLETSEELPAADEVYQMLRNAGERGLLAQFPAVLVGLAKATNLERTRTPAERQAYRDDQRAAVLRAFAQYHPAAMLVFGVDIGHTDPQWVLPYGGRLTVDGPGRRITAHY
jgi:muramoyltetrapeptide carboxypeptidase LdcA involved in peptidoglycan recycling